MKINPAVHDFILHKTRKIKDDDYSRFVKECLANARQDGILINDGRRGCRIYVLQFMAMMFKWCCNMQYRPPNILYFCLGERQLEYTRREYFKLVQQEKKHLRELTDTRVENVVFRVMKMESIRGVPADMIIIDDFNGNVSKEWFTKVAIPLFTNPGTSMIVNVGGEKAFMPQEHGTTIEIAMWGVLNSDLREVLKIYRPTTKHIIIKNLPGEEEEKCSVTDLASDISAISLSDDGKNGSE